MTAPLSFECPAGRGCFASICRTIVILILGSSCMAALGQNSVTLEWDPSPDLRVVDYLVYYGVKDGQPSLTVRSAGKTRATLGGLKRGYRYFFAVAAMDSFGQQSDRTPEVEYTFPCADRSPVLDLIATGDANEVRLTFGSGPGRRYEVEASADFKSWTPIWTSSVPSLEGMLTFSDPARSAFLERRFYRTRMTGPFAGVRDVPVTSQVDAPVKGLKVGFNASPGKYYDVVASDDGQSWFAVWSSPLITSDRWLEFIDPVVSGANSRQYRLYSTFDPAGAQASPCGDPVSLPPVVSSIPIQIAYRGYPIEPIPFAIDDPDTPIQDLRITVESSNPPLINNGGIAIQGAGTNRTLLLTPNPNHSGKAIVSIVVSDGENESVGPLEVDVLDSPPATFKMVVTRLGSGTVSPDLDGKMLKVGSKYSMTAKPGPGQIFAGWTGGITSSAPKLTFTMLPNLRLDAVFVANPFTPMEGAYFGLFREASAVRVDRAGSFSVTPTERGTFSGRLQLGGKRYSFSGSLDLQRRATASIKRSGANALVVELAFGGAGYDEVTGRVTDGAWQSPLLGYRTVFNSKVEPAPQAAGYTMIARGRNDPAQGPEGDSYATVKADGNSMATFAGVLADGTKVSQRIGLSRAGLAPFHAPLYSGGGMALGWLTVTNAPGGAATSAVSGSLHWIKSVNEKAKYYKAGFATDVPVSGSKYVRPASANIPVISLTDGHVAFSQGNIAPAFSNSVRLAGNKLTNLGDNKLSMSISLSSGLFSGSVVNPATGRSASFKGALLQSQNSGAGFLLGTNRSSRVSLGP
jgi:hypothetical protein